MSTAVDVLTPETAKVGDGATIVLWSDRHACTIVKVTKAFVWVQRDNAVLSGDWKPEWISGGFVGHCVNQHEQEWTYTPDPSGVITKFAWSASTRGTGSRAMPGLSPDGKSFTIIIFKGEIENDNAIKGATADRS